MKRAPLIIEQQGADYTVIDSETGELLMTYFARNYDPVTLLAELNARRDWEWRRKYARDCRDAEKELQRESKENKKKEIRLRIEKAKRLFDDIGEAQRNTLSHN